MSGQRWIPLESNPEIYNEWAKQAGLIAADAHFQDVYGLEDEASITMIHGFNLSLMRVLSLQLLGFVTGPVRAVILLFPDWEDGKAKRKEEDERIAREGQPKLDKTILWIKQTISNACGTMALIHSLANSDVTIAPMSPLATFIDECKDKTPLERAKILETTTAFKDIHLKNASSGQSSVPEDLHVDLHFIAFVQAPDQELKDQAGSVDVNETEEAPAPDEAYSGMRLIELDGERGGPIDRGECKDLLKDVAKYVKEKFIGESSSIQFNLIALGGPAPEYED